MSTITLKHIVVSQKNYDILKSLGNAGDSFNDVISIMLKNLEKSK
jgi:predicted CopG family antitoxin